MADQMPFEMDRTVSMETDANGSVYSTMSPVKKEKSSRSWKRKHQCYKACEVLILTPVMLIIIGLYSTPTILFFATLSVEKEVRVC